MTFGVMARLKSMLISSTLLFSSITMALSVPFNQFAVQLEVLKGRALAPATGFPVANSTKSFWIDTKGANPLAKEGSKGPLTQDADVCIIGGGITGVSAAYHLSKKIQDKGLKVVILEARDFC